MKRESDTFGHSYKEMLSGGGIIGEMESRQGEKGYDNRQNCLVIL